MAINLNEHKFFDYESKLDVVPLSIALKAVAEAIEETHNKQLDDAIKTLSEELTSMQPDLTQLNVEQ